jgi:hypothetical protein|tara:strand:- start:347 stop:553 length:207 start_codon:yes stop_codon:yes gene_type:complete
MKSIEFLTEIYDEKDDNYTIVDIDHKRRPRITLRHLQKLRKTRSIEDLEQKQRIDDVAYIYGRPDEEL